jgi:hypothetical protein
VQSDLRTTIDNYGYYQQAALVNEACLHVIGEPMHSFTLLFIESNPPHCIDFVQMKPEDIVRGGKLNRIALRKFSHGMRTGEWPGPRGDRTNEAYVDLSDWQRTRLDHIIERELK